MAVKDVSAARMGRVVLKTRKSDQSKAQDFADQVSRQIATRNPGRTVPPRPPVKARADGVVTEEDIISVDERLKVPRVGMLIAACLHLVVMVVTLLIGSYLLAMEAWFSVAKITYNVTELPDAARGLNVDNDVDSRSVSVASLERHPGWNAKMVTLTVMPASAWERLVCLYRS